MPKHSVIKQRAKSRVFRIYNSLLAADKAVHNRLVESKNKAVVLPSKNSNVWVWRINAHQCPGESYLATLPPWFVLSSNTSEKLNVKAGDTVFILASGQSAVKNDVGVYVECLVVHNAVRCQLYDGNVQDYHSDYQTMRKRNQWRVAVRVVKRHNYRRCEIEDYYLKQITPTGVVNPSFLFSSFLQSL